MARWAAQTVKPDTVNYYIRMSSAETGKIITRIEPIERVKRMVTDKVFKDFVEDLIDKNKLRFGGTDWQVSVKTASRTEELFPLETEE